MKDKNKNNKSTSGLLIGICIGISVGLTIGLSAHNIGLWMPVGIAAGMCIGLVFDRSDPDDNKDNTDTKK